MGGKPFKRRLVHSVAVAAYLFNTKFSLVMSPFSRDVIKTEKTKYQHCFNSQSVWLLDGRTSLTMEAVEQLRRVKIVVVLNQLLDICNYKYSLNIL